MYKFFSLERVTSSGNFQPEIDGLRFLAIFPVLLTHAYYVYLQNVGDIDIEKLYFIQYLFVNGGTGVHIFFVISGYVLGGPFYKAATSGKNNIAFQGYVVRRLTRLEPPYIISLLFFSCVLLFQGADLRSLSQHFFASTFYVHNIIYGVGSTINNVAWSLEVEFQFYLLAPLLYFVYKDKARSILYFIALIIVFLFSNEIMGERYRSILSQGHFFILGALLHPSIRHTNKIFERMGSFVSCALLFICLLLLFSFKTISSDFFINCFKILILFILFSATFCDGVIKRLFSVRWLYLVGGICYSIYLLHYPLLSFLSKVYFDYLFIAGGQAFFVFILFSVSVTMLVSSIFAILIERPFMNFKLFRAYLLSTKYGDNIASKASGSYRD